MLRKFVLTSAFALMLPSIALAETAQYGTAEEARAMLDRAVTLLQAEGRGAIPQLDSDAFRDRDLYVFCANVSDSITVVHPMSKGRRLLDYDFGEELMSAPEGEIKEMSYKWERPGVDPGTLVDKFSYYTRVGDLVCGVGYYKE
jgi:hypothetical protein